MLRNFVVSSIACCMLAVGAMGAEIVVRVGPPRPVYEQRGRAPQRGYVYQKGYHRWDGNRHVWTPGVWVAPPRPRAQWVEPRWQRRSGQYVFVEGRWR